MIEKRLGRALLAQDKISQFNSDTLGSHHWGDEVRHIFASMNARTQINAWSIASGEDSIHEGKDGYVNIIDPKKYGNLCGMFKYNPRGYASIHYLAFIWVIASWPLFFSLSRKWPPWPLDKWMAPQTAPPAESGNCASPGGLTGGTPPPESNVASGTAQIVGPVETRAISQTVSAPSASLSSNVPLEGSGGESSRKEGREGKLPIRGSNQEADKREVVSAGDDVPGPSSILQANIAADTDEVEVSNQPGASPAGSVATPGEPSTSQISEQDVPIKKGKTKAMPDTSTTRPLDPADATERQEPGVQSTIRVTDPSETESDGRGPLTVVQLAQDRGTPARPTPSADDTAEIKWEPLVIEKLGLEVWWLVLRARDFANDGYEWWKRRQEGYQNVQIRQHL